MADLKDIIRDQIEANNASMQWGESYLKGQEKKENRQRLIENRIALNRINYAAGLNPGAAVFGESQVGKSYMVDCLLTSETSPLNVYDAQGKATGFLKSINPTGGGREATALISRFTTKKVWDNPAFPIKCVLLTPIDIVCVIVDSYYNDLKDFQLRADAEVEAEIERLQQKYGSQPVQQHIIGEDQIYELKEYFESGLMERGEIFRNALSTKKYFERLAEIINRVGVSQWADVFGFLWNHKPVITNLFENLIRLLQKFDFARTVYIKTEAVLRSGGTILHVDRIYEMFGIDQITEGDKSIIISKASVPTMEVMTDKGALVQNVSKSEFCALAMEIDFTIDDPTKDYGGEDSPLVKEKPFLKNLDILDFPGARSREKIVESDISKQNACNMILRGKVAYLFNKYSSQYLISNLFFCHHDVKCEVSTLGDLLRGWVNKTIGETPKDRASFIQESKVSPLFMIGTKFNIDMVRQPDDSNVDSRQELQKRMEERWTKRFGNLKDIVRPSATNDWFNNWTTEQTYFNNIYLLRSFAYSCQTGLYRGYQQKVTHPDGHVTWDIRYDENGKMCGESSVDPDYVDFFEDLYKTFSADDFVDKHFPKTLVPTKDHRSNKLQSWAEVTEVGKDGSDWIIENLTISADHMVKAREHQFKRLYTKTFENLLEVMATQYHDPSLDIILKETLEDAGRINLLLDGLFGSDKHFFTELLDRILIREDELHDMILEIIRNSVVVNDTDMQTLFAIRNRANIDPEETEEENRRRLRQTYNIETDAALDAFLSDMGLTVADIINPPKVRNLARIIVDAVEEFWLNQYLDIANFQDFVDRGMKEKYLEKLIDKMRALYKVRLKISDEMTRRIQVYVVDQSHIDEMAEMIADICAEMINRFVNTMGTAYFNPSTWDKLHQTVERNNFEIDFDFIEKDEDTSDQTKIRSNMNMVFDIFDNVDQILNSFPVDYEKLKFFSNYDAYHRWTNMMKMAFLVTCDIPTYEVKANNALRNLLNDYIFTKETKKDLMKDEYYDQYHLKSFKEPDPSAAEANAEA